MLIVISREAKKVFQTVFKRYESKYFINSKQYAEVLHTFERYAEPDRDTDCGYDESSAKTFGKDEKNISITAAGTYVITGSRTSVTVSAPETAKIQIVLKGADISNPDGPAIYITEADKVFLTAYKDTENSVSDGNGYSDEFFDTNADAAIFSRADLTVNGEGALDYRTSAVISGGTAILCGSSGMAESFSQDSSQPSFMYTLDSAAGAGDSIAVSDASGRVIASFMPSKQYNNIVISSPEFIVGDSYTVTVGGTVSGCDANGFTQNGGVSGGETEFAVELTSAATVYGQSGGMGRGMNGGMGGMSGGGRPSGGRTVGGR